MNIMKNLLILVSGLFFISCSGSSESEQKKPEKEQPEAITIQTNNMEIIMPDTLNAGLNHLVYRNNSDMTHFLLFNKVPEFVDLEKYQTELTMPFQELMNAISENRDPEAAFPEWLAEMVNMGGVGLISAGGVAESYVDFPPGNYVVECYIKYNGVFHSSTGMLKHLRIIDRGQEEITIDAALTINVDSTGISLEGDLPGKPGMANFKVVHGTTRLYPNFTRPDVHLAKITDEAGLEELNEYMDWSSIEGMVAKSPATFLGGVQEMPEGNISYFSHDLGPGKYVLIGEVPDPKSNNFFIEFEIPAEMP